MAASLRHGRGDHLRYNPSMNIEKLETILQEMRAARFTDLAATEKQVEAWADQIAGAITDHLVSSLDNDLSVGPAPELSSEPGGYDWGGSDPES